MARFVGPSTIWCKKLFQLCSELLPYIHLQHFLEIRTGSLYTPCSASVLCLYCLFSLQCLFITACPNHTFMKTFMISPGESIFTPQNCWSFTCISIIQLITFSCIVIFVVYLPSLLEYMPSRKWLISTQAFKIFMGSIEVCFILEFFLVTDYTLVSWLMVNIK